MEENRYIESNKIYGLAVTCSRCPSDICFDWIESLYTARRFQDIILISEKIIDRVKCPALLKNTCGMCHLHLGDFDQALELFQEVSQLDSLIRICHFNQVLSLYLKVEDRPVFETIYRREITLLEQDLAKEENDEIKEKIKFRLRGFNQILVMLYKRKSEKQG